MSENINLILSEKKNPFLDFFFRIYFKYSLKRNFLRINFKGKKLLDEIVQISAKENSPVIICVNHSNWWDGVLLNWISNYVLKGNAYCLMDTVDLSRHRYFNKIGAIPLERKNKFSSFRTLKFCKKILTGKNRYLWIFPQGEIIPNERMPYRFFNGVSYLCENIDKFNLMCVHFEYRFTAEQHPEIYVNVFRSFENKDINTISRKDFTEYLEKLFVDESNKFTNRICKNDYSGFEVILKGRKSINQRIITRSV